MNTAEVPGLSKLYRRCTSALAALAVILGMLVTLSAAPVPKAEASEYASNFCGGWLDPAWTGIYRCDSPDNVSGYGRDLVSITTVERAGCVDYADVWHNLVNSWTCFPNHTQGYMSIRQDGGWYRGAIRNNNSTYRAQFVGSIWW